MASSRLRKAKKPKQLPKRPLIYMLAIGTPNEVRTKKGYPEEKHAKLWATKFLQSHIPWCERVNPAGIKAIEQACLDVDGLPVLLKTKRRITCLLDEHTGFTICVDLWKESE